MLRLAASCRFWFASETKLKLEKFSNEEVAKMCKLLNTKYMPFNDDIKVFRDIKLLDEKGKLVGMYTPALARQKAQQMKKDLVMFNENSTPIICKLLPFKTEIVHRFYNERVMKNKEEILTKRTKVKSIKLSPNLTTNELKVKALQMLQTVKKQAQVQVHMRAPKPQDDEKILQKMETFKNMLGSGVRIVKEISTQRYVEDQNEQEEEEEQENSKRGKTFRFLFESAKDEFKNKVQTILKENPEDAIKVFIKKYEQQEETEMRQLNFELEGESRILKTFQKKKKSREEEEEEDENEQLARKKKLQQEIKVERAKAFVRNTETMYHYHNIMTFKKRLKQLCRKETL